MRNLSLRRLLPNMVRAVRVDVAKHGLRGFVLRVPYYLRNYRRYVGVLGVRPPSGDGAAFSAAAPVLREIRLHPNLGPEPQPLAVRVSVVIPTLNAGPEFKLLLRKLKSQRAIGGVEIVVVDSGSRDGTVQAAHDAGARVVQIAPSEFSHSHARNLGADHASGDLLLFTVQDAYPIGDLWLYGLASYLAEHAPEKLAAVSCGEYSRGDSDMMYDAMIDTHYRFLGCLEHDRIGEFAGDDHMALRSLGQLSDVACLIPRERFAQYRYRGNYAEDLDLGIRLIKDGWRVAMLASVKVVHSHNRPAYYYLKRTFVDVIFLTGLFDDFAYPQVRSLEGLATGIGATAARIGAWLQSAREPAGATLPQELQAWIEAFRGAPAPSGAFELPDARLQEFVARLVRQHGAASPLKGAAADEARMFHDGFLARLEHFRQYCERVYGPRDATLDAEVQAVVCKSFSAAAGAALAYFCLGHKQAQDAQGAAARALFDELVAGV